MIEDIDRIADFLRGMDRDDFLSDLKTVYAVTNAFIRIGEAAGRVPEEIRQRHPEIEWREIRHFRNFMTHVYDAIDASHLWEAAANDLPQLQPKLKAVLDGTGSED